MPQSSAYSCYVFLKHQHGFMLPTTLPSNCRWNISDSIPQTCDNQSTVSLLPYRIFISDSRTLLMQKLVSLTAALLQLLEGGGFGGQFGATVDLAPQAAQDWAVFDEATGNLDYKWESKFVLPLEHMAKTPGYWEVDIFVHSNFSILFWIFSLLSILISSDFPCFALQECFVNNSKVSYHPSGFWLTPCSYWYMVLQFMTILFFHHMSNQRKQHLRLVYP